MLTLKPIHSHCMVPAMPQKAGIQAHAAGPGGGLDKAGNAP